MRYATVVSDHGLEPATLAGDRLLTFDRLARDTGLELPASLLATVVEGDAAVRRAYGDWLARFDADALPAAATARFALPFRPPGKIWGIGLNYRDHARDLDEEVPPAPASFMRPPSSAIGEGDTIGLPAVSQRVTAEAELAVIFGRRTRNVEAGAALDAVFGYTTVLDLTAEDILRVNPRFLTRAKSFDGFFSFGPVIVTPDEITDLSALTVRIEVNGVPGPANQIRNMTYGPAELIAFHSHGMTWEPGDILSTGTPGAVRIAAGDDVACLIDGVGVLRNAVA
jgi:2-keto-4-pentenoate hydratase/2-oxohepta-3-ene-1,7-dioic acid hydratase in catechol pathway